jgi:hypothetical protein
MKKHIVALLMFISCSAWSEWVKIMEKPTPERGGVTSFYFDPTTIRKDKDRRRVWQLTDFRGKDGEASRRYLSEYDCGQERTRGLEMTSHTGSMATGEETGSSINFPTLWSYVAPRTPDDIVMKIVCAK